MSRTEINENEAIQRVVDRKQSSGYLRAVAANIPVTVVVRGKVVRMHNGKREEIASVTTSKKLRTPKTYKIQ